MPPKLGPIRIVLFPSESTEEASAKCLCAVFGRKRQGVVGRNLTGGE